jgi:hypothetical protein
MNTIGKLTAVTELETELLKKIAKSLYAEHGFTDIELDDISDNTKRDRGVLASLIKKGIVEIYEQRSAWGDPYNFDGILITDDYIQAVRTYTGIEFWEDYIEGSNYIIVEEIK